MPPSLKAYAVNDDDECTVVVFAKTGVEARRKGAAKLDIEFEAVGYCIRMPEFDRYAPGPVPIMATIEHGWWWECYGCNTRINSDSIEDEGLEPIALGDGIWCSEHCLQGYLLDKVWRESAQDEAVKSLKARLLAKFPEIWVARTHGYAVKRDGEYVAEQVIVSFTFPGSRHGQALCRIDKGHERPLFYVPNGDLDAWQSYCEAQGRPVEALA